VLLVAMEFSANFFVGLQAVPCLGRAFRPEE